MSLPNITKPADGHGRSLALVEKSNSVLKLTAESLAPVKEQPVPIAHSIGLAYELEDERLPSVSSF
jgi:hypothetical protein